MNVPVLFGCRDCLGSALLESETVQPRDAVLSKSDLVADVCVRPSLFLEKAITLEELHLDVGFIVEIYNVKNRKQRSGNHI